MLMFRFWGSDSRGSSDKTCQIDQSMIDFVKPTEQAHISQTVTAVTTSPSPQKRRRPSNAAISSLTLGPPPAAKRRRVGDENIDGNHEGFPSKKVAMAEVMDEGNQAQPAARKACLGRARGVIEYEFSHAILLKHQELRFINQELAKCQAALEQLRRCHLIPYPVNVPTPEQMLNVTNGQGPALQARIGSQVPQWAPPFGVTDGPYARHYAKWLIPDPKFDGIQPSVSVPVLRIPVDSRSMRNSAPEVGGVQGRGRSGRASIGHRLQSLSNGYPQAKDKAGPCVLKRAADGETVKLVCTKCHRDNFSSTQGFINHCRIAHKIEYKSHEEAAIACGQPIEADQAGAAVSRGKSVVEPPSAVSMPTPVVASAPMLNATPTLGSRLVHPFARENALSESEACFSVLARIRESVDLYNQGHLGGITSSLPDVPKSATAPGPAQRNSASFTPSTDSPALSRLLQSRGASLNLEALVREAKTKIDLNDAFADDSDDDNEAITDAGLQQVDAAASVAPRIPRLPARMPMSPVPAPALPAGCRPMSSKGHPSSVPYATPIPTPAPRLPDTEPECPIEDEMDLDLSPNTAISNNAPSLVSDDDEYDDSVDGSCSESEVNDEIDNESVTDVAEIGFDDDHLQPRALRHHRGSSGAGTDQVRLRKEENKHVTFISPIKENNAHRRGRRVSQSERIL